MSAASLILSRGAIPKIDQAGQLALDLSNVPHDQRPELVALARQHKTAILEELAEGPSGSPLSIPPTMAKNLLCCGYHSPEWTPTGCRAFLAELMREWPGFHVNGWSGLTMPECWPVALMEAVQSIYVMSIQNQGEDEA